MRAKLFAILFLCLAQAQADAHNNEFLPGDAFFSAEISRSEIVRWAESREPDIKLHYSRLDGTFFACGFLGYSTLVLEGVSPELRASLVEAYWRFADSTRPLYREEGNDGESVLAQTNSVVALVYNRDFDLRLPLGLKFKEDWVVQGNGTYGGFLDSAKAVAADWRSAASVAPLTLREKLDPTAHVSTSYEVPRTLDKPLHAKGGEVQIILVGFVEQGFSGVAQDCPDLQEIFEGAPGARYMVVTEGLIRDFHCEENGLWKETPIKLPLVGEESWVPKKPAAPRER